MDSLKDGIVSLIVPCYNGEQVIERCLDSVMKQTCAHQIELILVNDGSTDATNKIVDSHEKKLREVLYDFKYIVQENGGVGAAVNTALKIFTGEFLALLDADDYMMPESVEIRYCWLKDHPDYAAVLNTGYYVTENDYFTSTNLFTQTKDFDEKNTFQQMLDGKLLNWPGTYMLRSANWLKRCPDREIYPSRAGQNMQMLLPTIYHGKCGYIDQPLMRYLVQENSLSHFSNDQNGQKAFSMIYCFQDIYEHVIEAVCDDGERDGLLLAIRISSVRTRMGIALKYKNQELVKKAMNELNALDAVSLNDKIQFYDLTHPTLGVFFHFIRRIKYMLHIR